MSSPVACEGGAGAVGATVAAALQFFAASQCLLRENWPPNAAVENGSRWDLVVVGGGTAGAALAARLARLPASVLLLEAGGDPPQESIVPGFHDVLKGSEYDWKFKSEEDADAGWALPGGQNQPRGRMLGGSGSLNDMVYARGFPADYHQWAAVAGDGWNWTAVLNYFKKTEHLTDERIINDPELMQYHGRHGEIEVAGLNESTYTTDRFLEAFGELGFPLVKDMTNPNLIGVGRFSHTIRDGRRDSTLTALLNKENGRRNLKVVKNALVTKILFENDTAQGVEVLINNDQFTFFANKEVIVSAGTFNTAKLLLLSGIGPKEHLEDLGIDVVKDLPVGENLQDHVMVLTFLAADNGTCYSEASAPFMEIIRYLYDRSGSFSKTNSMGAYIAAAEGDVPEFAIYPSCIPMGTQFYNSCLQVLGFEEKICAKFQSELNNHEILTLAVVLLKPKSRGSVRLHSTDPLAPPLIQLGIFSDPSDLEGFPKALEVAWSVANTTYFRSKNARVVDFELEICAGLVGAEAARCWAQAVATSAWHAAGTAALGGALDGELRARGLRALRVADASAMPQVVRGNTNAPVVMIAEKAADFIKHQYFKRQAFHDLQGVFMSLYQALGGCDLTSINMC